MHLLNKSELTAVIINILHNIKIILQNGTTFKLSAPHIAGSCAALRGLVGRGHVIFDFFERSILVRVVRFRCIIAAVGFECFRGTEKLEELSALTVSKSSSSLKPRKSKMHFSESSLPI